MVVLVKRELYQYSETKDEFSIIKCSFKFFKSIKAFEEFREKKIEEFFNSIFGNGSRSAIIRLRDVNGVRMSYDDVTEEIAVVEKFSSKNDGLNYLRSNGLSDKLDSSVFTIKFSKN